MGDEVTSGELTRRMDTLQGDVRALAGSLAERVHRDVYDAHRAADAERDRRMQADIERIVREADEREAVHVAARGRVRVMVTGAVLACVGSTVAGVVVGMVLR